jgi:hypothetical protein
VIEGDDRGVLSGGFFEGGKGEVVDESGEAGAEVVDFVDGLVVDEVLMGAGGGEMMTQVEGGMGAREWGDDNEESDALAQGFMEAEAELLEERVGAGENDGEEIFTVEMEIGEKPDDLESGMGNFLAFIENENRVDGIKFFEALLKLPEHGAFRGGGFEIEMVT